MRSIRKREWLSFFGWCRQLFLRSFLAGMRRSTSPGYGFRVFSVWIQPGGAGRQAQTNTGRPGLLLEKKSASFEPFPGMLRRGKARTFVKDHLGAILKAARFFSLFPEQGSAPGHSRGAKRACRRTARTGVWENVLNLGHKYRRRNSFTVNTPCRCSATPDS